ncbi:hypothetical protein ACFW1A_09450 [Kitasatospora sp. NPDC058965]|uniref:hypothetical protein n=1 Tax=Kitasatospora sp. NPDC058965 TaxID=3346682 RepID=UPI00368BA459
MASQSSDPLAGVVTAAAAGPRLVFVPGRFRQVGYDFGASVLVPLWIAAPLLAVTLALAALFGAGVIWGVFWAVLGLTALAVIVLGAGVAFPAVVTMVRWIEFRSSGSATQLVVAGFLRSSTLAVTDLQRVVVSERLRLGRRASVTVVLHTTGGPVDCEPGLFSPLSQVGTDLLVEWLTEQLDPAGVPVELRSDVRQRFVCPDEWWTRSELAARWQVPVSAVDGLAARHGVRGYRYTPRAAAMSSPHSVVTVYDPGRAHEVAEAVRAGG